MDYNKFYSVVDIRFNDGKSKCKSTVVKMIVGNRGAITITEKVYTHVDMKMLVEAVSVI